ncbi:hypothetical protein DEE10_24460 [Escherichia coli]|nr:hypothetical protein [Escherichia coli]MFB52295.1 hypothetical protein [Escherichia coli]
MTRIPGFSQQTAISLRWRVLPQCPFSGLSPVFRPQKLPRYPRSPHFGINVKPVGQHRCQHRRFFLREYKRFNGLWHQRFRQGPWR